MAKERLINKKWLTFCLNESSSGSKSDAWNALIQKIKKANVEKCSILPFPLLVRESVSDALYRATLDIFAAQSVILNELLKGRSQKDLLDFLDLPSFLVEFIDWTELFAMEKMIARVDIVPGDEGFKICEFNLGSVIGGPELLDYLKSYCLQLGIPVSGDKPTPMPDISQLVISEIQTRNLENLIILVSSNIEDMDYFIYRGLADGVTKALPKLNVEIHNETSYPEAYHAKEFGEKTLIYRVFSLDELHFFQDLFRKVKASNATFINTFETEIRMSKKWFELFHLPEYQNLLTPQQIQAIVQFIPHTFELTPAKLKSVLLKKGQYVFKLANSSGGRGVLVGAEYDLKSLQAKLFDKSKGPWLVQELIAGEDLEIPYEFDESLVSSSSVFGLYIIEGKNSGMDIRATHKSKLVSVSASQAYEGWVIPVSEPEVHQFKESFAAKM